VNVTVETSNREKAGARVLVVEDEMPMRMALEDILKANGYRVLAAADGQAGLALAVEEKPDLILLDVMMPKLDGLALCAELRRLTIAVPVLMLTARGQVEDRVAGLDRGADDYLVKPFSTAEFLARVRALLRRARAPGRVAAALAFGDVEIDFIRMTVRRAGQPVYLTAREFGVLRLLAEAAGEPVTRERFLDVVWGYAAFPTTRTVDNHIASLRGKLERDSEVPRWIQTVHGVGYRLETGGAIWQNRDSSGAPAGHTAGEEKEP
jgi:DNA-binding response OmpR family regulator